MGKGGAHAPEYSTLLIVGAGLSGIATAWYFKKKFGEDYVIYDRQRDLGGTWWANRYPGYPAMLYSFSFEPKYDWSHFFPEQAEILDYTNGTAIKWGIKPKIRFSSEVERAEWIEETKRWRVYLRRRTRNERWALDSLTGKEREEDETWVHECKVLISAVGQLTVPVPCTIPGHENFKGALFHSSRWDNGVDVTGKDIVVVGNGCTAAQLIPAICASTKSTTQFMRTPQWIVPRISPLFFRSNESFAKYGKYVFKYIPFFYSITRFLVFLDLESQFAQFKTTKQGNRERGNFEAQAMKFMKTTIPEKYHDFAIPKYSMGCKRRIFDDGYLASLNHPKVHLTNDKISHIEPDGVATVSGKKYPADVIVMANGFDVRASIPGFNITGKYGETLDETFKMAGGPNAYNTCAVNGFPNFFFLFGPNSVTGYMSVLVASEYTAGYVMKLIEPVVKGQAGDVEVTKKAQVEYANIIQAELKNTVWSNSICRSWYVIESGINSTLYPFTQFHFIWRSLFPVWSDWDIRYTPSALRWKRFMRFTWLAMICALGFWSVTRPGGILGALIQATGFFKSIVRGLGAWL
ncbi:4-hydroxyacetophenone monooxygenase [Kalaharituber pfeilii]|nr:4-hydroxyacetophenone monooxygenase [Kalaharituber pfeilii]